MSEKAGPPYEVTVQMRATTFGELMATYRRIAGIPQGGLKYPWVLMLLQYPELRVER